MPLLMLSCRLAAGCFLDIFARHFRFATPCQRYAIHAAILPLLPFSPLRHYAATPAMLLIDITLMPPGFVFAEHAAAITPLRRHFLRFHDYCRH